MMRLFGTVTEKTRLNTPKYVLGVLAFAAAGWVFLRLVKSVKAAHIIQGKSGEFQNGNNHAIRTIKKNDFAVMMQMLGVLIDFDQYKKSQKQLVLTDIGGGEGLLLKPFEEMGFNLLVHCCEPDQSRRDKYIKRIDDYKKIGEQKSTFTTGLFTPAKLEAKEFRVPSSDLVVASHSLYYTARQWEKLDLALEEHLFTKLLLGVKPKGALCIILQSHDGERSISKFGINADLEDITYEIRDRLTYSEKSPIPRKQQETYANSEMLYNTLKLYAEKLEKQTGIKLTISRDYSCPEIELGKLNFDPDDKGQYPQTGKAKELLNSLYVRKNTQGRYHYDGLPGIEQRKILDWLAKHCRKQNGEYAIAHPNGVITVVPSQPLQLNPAGKIHPVADSITASLARLK